MIFRGAKRDRQDKSKWHTEQGPLSVTGPKFTNWRGGQAGGGAIDLVMHLAGVGCITAVEWLERHFAPSLLAAGESAAHASGREATPLQRLGPLRLPVPDLRMLDRVRTISRDAAVSPRPSSIRLSNQASCTRTASPTPCSCWWPGSPIGPSAPNCVPPRLCFAQVILARRSVSAIHALGASCQIVSATRIEPVPMSAGGWAIAPGTGGAGKTRLPLGSSSAVRYTGT